MGRNTAPLPPITGIQINGPEVDCISNKEILGKSMGHMEPLQPNPPYTQRAGQDVSPEQDQQPGYISSDERNVQAPYLLLIYIQHKPTLPLIENCMPMAIMDHCSV